MHKSESFPVWTRKDILNISSLSRDEVLHILDVAGRFSEINQRAAKKVPILKGKSVVLFFAEPSTRTKTSFDVAGKRLSADTFSLGSSSSSLTKGESIKDTALTLEAMNPDAIVVRHSSSGASDFISQKVGCAVINAGDGKHAHPTQALLDSFTLSQHWDDFTAKKVLILGDIAHSRVARSNVSLLRMLGAEVRICAPRTLLPSGIGSWPVQVFSNLHEACCGVDAVICLRLQLERQNQGLLPDLREYAAKYGLGFRHLKNSSSNVKIMHPGPINRGIEIESSLADAGQSIILNQVSSGVSVRMALLYLAITRSNPEGN